MGKDASDIRQEIADTRADLGDTVEALAYKTDVKARAKDAVDERVSAAKGTVANAVETVKSTVAAAAGMTGETVRKQRGNVARLGYVMDNPLGLVGGAFAVGFLAGLALPISDVERERVGPLRDALVERAQDAANDALKRGRHMVTDAMTSTHRRSAS